MHTLAVGVIYGGKSTEHEVSIKSAKGIITQMDPMKYAVKHIFIDKSGHWYLQTAEQFQQRVMTPKSKEYGRPLVIRFGEGHHSICFADDLSSLQLDVIFPIIHGNFGEDGCLQGLLRMAEIPFVGSDVLGSALGMDKEVAKRLLYLAGIPNARYRCIKQHETWPDFHSITQELGPVLFVKPARQGSSVGISKVDSEQKWRQALQTAFEYDTKILVEEYIKGREIEVSVLGNEQPKASIAGEIVPQAEFYSYEAKYIDPNGAKLVIPAELSASVLESIRDMAIKTYTILECAGMARVDFFITADKCYINEINTIPGFTSISMYPKLWEASGLKMQDLIGDLLTLAIARHQNQVVKLSSLEL